MSAACSDLAPIDHAEATLDPSPDAWSARLRSAPTHPLIRRFREQLGLPTDRPIVMTGHQAEIWHAGILARFAAAHAAAQHTGAHLAFLAVDQDSNDPLPMRFPVRERDALRVATWP
ncbi:MAG: hypothetical protein AAGK04_14340, partial [Planctomycetota bacterium]